MNLIRKTLEVLSKLLNLLFNIHVEPKHFRNAKFDKTDDNSVKIFWSLLIKLTNCKTKNYCSINEVKLFLHSLNYKSLSFYSLPLNMSHGSYQLLLAFAFLINKGYLHKYLKENVSKEPEIKSYNDFKPYEALHSKWNENKLIQKQSVEWIKGKLINNHRLIDEIKIGIEKFVVELNENVSKPFGNLTLSEWLAFGKDKRYERDFCYEIDKKILTLEFYEKFIRMERVFWNWMNSVCQINTGSYIKSDEIEKFYALVNERKKKYLNRK